LNDLGSIILHTAERFYGDQRARMDRYQYLSIRH